MYIKFILPALTEAHGKHWRPIKYSLFPPLGLATLAGYLNDSDEAKIVDEHVEKVDLDDRPDLVAIEQKADSNHRASLNPSIVLPTLTLVALGTVIYSFFSFSALSSIIVC